MGGDLNLVLNIEEKFGGTYHTNPSRDALETIMEQNKLINIPPSNGKYTWNNKRVGKNNVNEILDQILVQENIISSFNSARSKIIHAMASEHKPIAISLGLMDNQGPLPFKYCPIWNSSEDFRN